MGQDIFNSNGSSTGNVVQGVSIVKTPGVSGSDFKSRVTGFNNEPQGSGTQIDSLTGIYKERFDDPTYYG